jgi:hypothetical protein
MMWTTLLPFLSLRSRGSPHDNTVFMRVKERDDGLREYRNLLGEHVQDRVSFFSYRQG